MRLLAAASVCCVGERRRARVSLAGGRWRALPQPPPGLPPPAPVCFCHALPQRALRYTPLMLIISHLSRPYPSPNFILSPHTFSPLHLSFRDASRPFPCVTPLSPNSPSLRTQHLSHPRALSRCASLYTSFTPPPRLQIHCPATHLLFCSLLLPPQFLGMTPLTCHFMLLLCAAADSICASLFAPFRYSSASPSLSSTALLLLSADPLSRPATPPLACACLRLFAGCRC